MSLYLLYMLYNLYLLHISLEQQLMITKRKIKGNKKVLLGMSGGIDSSVAAYLLQQDGYEVVGATLKMFKDSNCSTAQINTDAKKVSDFLNIEYHTFDVQKDFNKYVIEYFISEYESGRTPNPCVICNRYVKFEGLLEKANQLGIDYISTGHYASVEGRDGRYLLKKGVDSKKDQSYFLYNLNQEQLSRVIFPLGKYSKEEVKEIAKKVNLPTKSKAESQEICFIKDNDYKKYISQESNTVLPEGEFVDTQGNILGYHRGILNYTIGQRRDLGISTGEPMYVLSIDADSNQIVLGSNNELFSKELTVKNLNWIIFDTLKESMEVKSKIRYGATEADSVIHPIEEGKVEVIFSQPQRAITRGQAIVFYKNNLVVGGGIIE